MGDCLSNHSQSPTAQSGRSQSPTAQSGKSHSPIAQSGKSHSPADPDSSFTYLLEPRQTEFPRSSAFTDGCVVRFRVLSRARYRSGPKSGEPRSYRHICIPSSIEKISDECFNCSYLSHVAFEFGSNLSTIGANAFEKCPEIRSFWIPPSVEAITGYSFRHCWGLSDLTFGLGSRISVLGHRAFEQCVSLQDLSFPASLEKISDYCFNGCGRLSRLRLESGCKLSRIGSSAFEHCSSLRSIGYSGSPPDSVIIPSSVTEVFGDCFGCCVRLSNVTFERPCRLRLLPSFVMCRSLRAVCIPSSVEALGGFCFSNCSDLSDVTFEPASRISRFFREAFQGCQSLRSIWIPATVELIDQCCFSRCSRLSDVAFEPGFRISLRIGVFAFEYCYSLSSFRIPSRVTQIAPSCFTQCSKLVTIVLEAGSSLPPKFLSDLQSKYTVTFEEPIPGLEICESLALGITATKGVNE
jgi:hypothetical protein